MKLGDIGKFLVAGDAPNYHSALSGALDVSEVTLDMIARCDSVVYLTDKRGNFVSSMPREILQFLHRNYQERVFSNILDHISDGVIAVDARGRIFYLNKAYIEILKVKPWNVIGRHIQVVEPKSLLSQIVSTHREVRSSRTYIESVKRYVALHIYPLYDKGNFSGAVSIFRDVTEAHELQGEVENMSEIIRMFSKKNNYQVTSESHPIWPVADGTMEEMLAACEKQLMSAILYEEGGNRTRTMKRLGMSRRTFYRKYTEYSLGSTEPTKDV